MSVSVIIFLFLTLFHVARCHSDGAPDSQCVSMMPRHDVPSQTVNSPYHVKVDKTFYNDTKINVSIESLSEYIKGFLLQARQVGENTAIGMFSESSLPENTKFVNCGNSKSAVTHSARLNVRTLTFDWEPPKGLSER
ncbi:putative defense protein Hdd11 isoform X2 [Xenia sp. Carnegie-2017]|uniref:putative defense protein Hdd11 isoform X2 n=1 Tax=Xenia sp. Carnegie-2017 TaxID=2897299 RepID=UPI001F0503C8|nr:putative defense protein Hdd11 isoform X2 [Xenia sp. Carnegie-2017]